MILLTIFLKRLFSKLTSISSSLSTIPTSFSDCEDCSLAEISSDTPSFPAKRRRDFSETKIPAGREEIVVGLLRIGL